MATENKDTQPPRRIAGMTSEVLNMSAIADATINQIHDLSERLSALVAKDNALRAAGAAGKFSPETLSKIYNLLAVPLKDQIGATP